MGKLRVVTDQVLTDAEFSRETIRAALRMTQDSMCSQPYCARKPVYGGRCVVHRRATPKETSRVR